MTTRADGGNKPKRRNTEKSTATQHQYERLIDVEAAE